MKTFCRRCGSPVLVNGECSTSEQHSVGLFQAMRRVHPVKLGDEIDGKRVVEIMPMALIDAIKERAAKRIAGLKHLIDNHCDRPELKEQYWHRVFGVEEMCWEAVDCIEKALQREATTANSEPSA